MFYESTHEHICTIQMVFIYFSVLISNANVKKERKFLGIKFTLAFGKTIIICDDFNEYIESNNY
jgi:hypothetical protein